MFSQPVLLALVRAGKTRDEAYRIVQRHAMKAWDERCDFRTLLEADPEVSVESLDEAFDLSRSLRNLDIVFDALDRIAASDRAIEPAGAVENGLRRRGRFRLA